MAVHLARRERVVHTGHHRTDLCRGPECHDQLWAVAPHRGDDVTRAHSSFEQGPGQTAGLSVEFPVGQHAALRSRAVQRNDRRTIGKSSRVARRTGADSKPASISSPSADMAPPRSRHVRPIRAHTYPRFEGRRSSLRQGLVEAVDERHLPHGTPKQFGRKWVDRIQALHRTPSLATPRAPRHTRKSPLDDEHRRIGVLALRQGQRARQVGCAPSEHATTGVRHSCSTVGPPSNPIEPQRSPSCQAS